MNKVLYNKFIILLTSKLLQTNNEYTDKNNFHSFLPKTYDFQKIKIQIRYVSIRHKKNTYQRVATSNTHMALFGTPRNSKKVGI
jgi:hypothetical protein